MTNERLADLAAAGVSIWLDDLSRERLQSGNLQSLITEDSVVGVTTNPTIFAAALENGQAYDKQVRELAARNASVDDAVREITVADVAHGCDVFRSTWEATDGVDGRVSLEVDPRLAHDTDATFAEAVDLWKAVDRPNLLVKIPATEAGLPAITKTLGEGVSVNVTLIFSVERYREVMGAFLDGLEQAAANGHNLASITSVASFFVSRVDTEIDKRLEKIGTDEALALRGKAGVANSRPRLRRVPRGVLGRALGGAGREGRQGAATALGLHRREEPGLPGHDVHHRAGRRRHRQHDAGEDPAGLRRPRRAPRRRGHRHRPAGPAGVRRDLRAGHRPHRRVPRAGERGRRQVREVLGRAAGDGEGTARRRQGVIVLPRPG
jgi:transaldolase